MFLRNLCVCLDVHTALQLRRLIYPEEEGGMFLRNLCVCLQVHMALELRGLFYPEEEGSMFIRNLYVCLQVHVALQLRGLFYPEEEGGMLLRKFGIEIHPKILAYTLTGKCNITPSSTLGNNTTNRHTCLPHNSFIK
jgi:hypothetical protein